MVAHKYKRNKGEIVVVGIDQALVNLGFALNTDGKMFTLVFKEPDSRAGQRLCNHRRNLKIYLSLYRPQLVAMEGYSIDSTNRPFDLGEIGGVVKCLLAELEIPCIVVAPKSLKRFVTGSGTASKDKMIAYVNKYYGVKTEDDNAADAAGLARFAEVYLTNNSLRRCELEGVKKFKQDENRTGAKKFKREKGV